MTIAACDDTTDNIGSSITNDVDNISIKDQVFNVPHAPSFPARF